MYNTTINNELLFNNGVVYIVSLNDSINTTFYIRYFRFIYRTHTQVTQYKLYTY